MRFWWWIFSTKPKSGKIWEMNIFFPETQLFSKSPKDCIVLIQQLSEKEVSWSNMSITNLQKVIEQMTDNYIWFLPHEIKILTSYRRTDHSNKEWGSSLTSTRKKTIQSQQEETIRNIEIQSVPRDHHHTLLTQQHDLSKVS